MKITDLTANGLIRLDVRGELIPLREINYRDVRVGDIFVKSPYGFGYNAIQITGKNIKDTEAGRWSLGEELLTYDVYHINDDGVVLDVKGHNFSYKELVKERWKLLGSIQNPVITLNYPGKPLNSRKDN
tara:strand:+ start:68 stop:454 length:387 start_codon:yes stop_codon:yes gene_type:complete